MFVLTVVFYTRNSRLDDYFTHLDLFVKYSTNIIGLVNNRNKDLYVMEIKSESMKMSYRVINDSIQNNNANIERYLYKNNE